MDADGLKGDLRLAGLPSLSRLADRQCAFLRVYLLKC
jgi:hypothetical protein